MDLERRAELHAKGFVVIPDPKEVHRCQPFKAHQDNFKQESPYSPGTFFEVDPAVGTIWQCPDCGLFWIVRRGEFGAHWLRMRWYHKEARIVKRLRLTA